MYPPPTWTEHSIFTNILLNLIKANLSRLCSLLVLHAIFGIMERWFITPLINQWYHLAQNTTWRRSWRRSCRISRVVRRSSIDYCSAPKYDSRSPLYCHPWLLNFHCPRVVVVVCGTWWWQNQSSLTTMVVSASPTFLCQFARSCRIPYRSRAVWSAAYLTRRFVLRGHPY